MEQRTVASFLDHAVTLARKGMRKGHGGPFGAVIVKQDIIVGEGWNQTFKKQDPTAHAEVQAIRHACKNLKTTELAGCVIYCTGEPCPMCMAAIYWAMMDGVYFANTKEQAALAGFDDSDLYKELRQPWNARSLNMVHYPAEDALDLFRRWEKKKQQIVSK